MIPFIARIMNTYEASLSPKHIIEFESALEKEVVDYCKAKFEHHFKLQVAVILPLMRCLFDARLVEPSKALFDASADFIHFCALVEELPNFHFGYGLEGFHESRHNHREGLRLEDSISA